MSTISKIRARVEAELAKRLIPRLIERGVDYHCRRRTRTWCDCHYCRAKARGTYEIGLVGQQYSRGYFPTESYVRRWGYEDNWEVWAAIRGARREKVAELRKTLGIIKEEPL